MVTFKNSDNLSDNQERV